MSRYFAQNELIIIRDNGWIVGLVTPHEVKEVERWPSTTVDAVMRPLNQLCAPETPITEALEDDRASGYEEPTVSSLR